MIPSGRSNDVCCNESVEQFCNEKNPNKLCENRVNFNESRKTYKFSISGSVKLPQPKCDYSKGFEHTFRFRKYHFKRKCKKKPDVMKNFNSDQLSISEVEMLNDKLADKFSNRLKMSNTTSERIQSSFESHQLSKTIDNLRTSSIENSRNDLGKEIDKSRQLLFRGHEIKRINQFTGRCLLILLMQLLIGQLLLDSNRVSALDTCLENCNCIHSKNKFIADCSALALDNLPVVKDELATKVQVLNLTRNAFIKLENEMFFTARMINLQKIYLSKGALQSIGNSTFYKLNNLVELDLSQNRLTVVPKNSFQSIHKLIILDLSFNQIRSILEYSFHSLKMLKILSLENNQISVIDPKAFLGLVELETLKLSDNQISYLASESLSPLNKLHTLTLASNRWLCDCKMRQLKEFLLHNRRINVLDQPICDNQPHNIWTEISIDSFLCTPRMVQNNSDRVYQVSQGSNLALECSFQVESTLDSQPAVIRWLWQNRPITNNSEGVVSSQRFLITEYDYYLTTETTSTPYLHNTTPSPKNQSSNHKTSSSNFKFPTLNQLDVDDEDGLPLIELHDLNQFHRVNETIADNQAIKSIDSDQQRNESTQRFLASTTIHPSFYHHSHSVAPFERHIVKRRIRKSRMEITFILELNQGTYWCEASNQAGSVALNFSVIVDSVIRRTDFIANNRASVSTPASSIIENNIVNKRSGIEIASGSDDALFNELNAADQTTGLTKHQPLLNTSNSIVVGLVLGILFGILLVLAVFSLLIVTLCRKKLTDQVDLMSPTMLGTMNPSGQNSSTGCSTENSLLSTLAQVNCLQANNSQACSVGGHPALSASGSTNDWYSTFANNLSTNNANSTNNTLNNLLTNHHSSNQNNYTNPLGIAAIHHSDTMSQFNSTNSLSLLSSNNLYAHCNLLTSHDHLLAGHHLSTHPHQFSHQPVNGNQTGANLDHFGTLNVMNLEPSLEKSDLNSNGLQIYDDDDLKKSKIA